MAVRPTASEPLPNGLHAIDRPYRGYFLLVRLQDSPVTRLTQKHTVSLEPPQQ
jgi:hypothetical protein